MKNNEQELKDKVVFLENKIKEEQEKLSSLILKALGIPETQKCEYCGCPYGIHRTDCSFMSKFTK